MDFSDLISEFGALPGQVPDVEEREPRFTRFVRSTAFDNPQMLALYRAQGLPVEEAHAEETYIVEPDDGDGDDGDGLPVLFEVGAFVAPGGLETAVTGDRVRLDLCAPTDPASEGTLVLELVRLRPAGVLVLKYRLPAPSGRVHFLSRPEQFGLRATLFLERDGLLRPLVFGPRVVLPRAN